ncbi:enolase C-terminal domain-like protein [Amycolatopsis sp. NBC_00438]|uniref:enolase C-terminal domain-like protein n=1 Tax=Amycolatopsis sp. NBC_00438 TaxID=2903558 RepID=UPI003FA4561D
MRGFQAAARSVSRPRARSKPSHSLTDRSPPRRNRISYSPPRPCGGPPRSRRWTCSGWKSRCRRVQARRLDVRADRRRRVALLVAQFRDHLHRGAASIVQPDVARAGGITPWLKVAHLAEAFNVEACPHFLMEPHVSLAAAVPNGRYVEHIPQLRGDHPHVNDRRKRPHRAPGNPRPRNRLGIATRWTTAAFPEPKNTRVRPATRKGDRAEKARNQISSTW